MGILQEFAEHLRAQSRVLEGPMFRGGFLVPTSALSWWEIAKSFFSS